MDNMTRGHPQGLPNPQDPKRALAKRGSLARKMMRAWGRS
jgi:hypothetical protein